MDSNVSRRRFVRTAAGAGALVVTGALAGCSDSRGNTSGDVVSGPDSENRFTPKELTISQGETVTWSFDSAGHNVSAIPGHSDKVKLPDGAEPFASYDGDKKFDTVDRGDIYEHTFETKGTYQYVCIPHVSLGMVGTIIVE